MIIGLRKTSPYIKCALTFAVFASSALYAEKPSNTAVAKAISVEFQDRPLQTRRLIARSLDMNGMWCVVDTEFYPNGDAKFYRRFGCTLNTGGMKLVPGAYVVQGELSNVVSPGSILRAKQIVFGSERVEIDLSEGNDEHSYAKIKLMLGKGYDAQPVNQVLDFINTIFVLPDIEQRVSVERVYRDALAKLADAKTLSSRASDDDERLQALKLMAQSYKILGGSRDQLHQLNDPLVSSDSADYSVLATQADEAIPKLEASAATVRAEKQEAARRGRITQNKAAYASCIATSALNLQALDRSKGLSEQEMSQRGQMIATLHGELALCQQFETALKGDGVADVDQHRALVNDFAHLKRVEDGTASLKAKAQYQGLANQYAPMASKLIQLRNAFIAAFGTPQEASTKAALTAHIRAMIDNREQAEAAGDPAAPKQLVTLQQELQRYR